MLKRVVWSAVIAAVLAASAVTFAVSAGMETVALTLGMAGIVAAVLSNRER